MASKTDSTRVMWRVQTKAKTGTWLNRGLYETRARARESASFLRNVQGYGYGRTRVIRYVRGGGR